MVKITLDAETFRALASSTRLTVLRALDERRKTLTELSRDLDLNKATVHEHLQLLTAADLVRKRDDEGRKWIYYELTWRGQKLLHPQETTTFNVLLGLGVLATGGGVAMLGRALGWWLATTPVLSGSESTPPSLAAPDTHPTTQAGIAAANTASTSTAAATSTSGAASSGSASASQTGSSSAAPGGAPNSATTQAPATTMTTTAGQAHDSALTDAAGKHRTAAPAPQAEHGLFTDDGWLGLALLLVAAVATGLAVLLRRRLRPRGSPQGDSADEP